MTADTHRDPTAPRGDEPAAAVQRAALWFGAVNLLLGLAGFFGPFVTGNDEGLLNVDTGRLFGILAINWAYALVLLAFGLYGLWARRMRAAALTYFHAVAVVFGLLALLGILGNLGWLVVRDTDGTPLVFALATNWAAVVLHLLWMAVGLASALAARREARASHAADGMRPMRAPVVLALILGGLLAIGLLNVLEKNTEVAPWAENGSTGRLHEQTKNVTRLGGGPAQVARAVQLAVAYDSAPSLPSAPAGDWRAQVLAASGWDPRPRYVVVLPGDGADAAAWALPGAYWAAFSGAPVVFAGRTGTPAPARLPVYVVAPRSLVPDELAARLASGAEVTRITARDPAALAVKLAQYRDERTGFGWGRRGGRLATWFHFIVAAPAEAAQAYAALPLARTVAGTFLFADDQGGIPAATDRYVWSQRADWVVTPAETSFRHFWVLGDRVSYGAQGRLDLAVEKSAYLSKGSAALGPLETIGIPFIALGIAGFLFVLLHAARLLPEVRAPNRIAWAFTALLVPVLGVVLYLAAYRRPRLNAGGGMAEWLRPPSLQAAAATAMGFGYGAPLMVAIGWAFVYYGFPLFFGPFARDGWAFLLGAGMPLMMLAMYLGAVLIAWPFVQTGMMATMKGAPRREVRWNALRVTALSMLAVSLGMMTLTWWMMMERKAMMMPKEDEILWFFTLWLASTVGFLVAWPLNYPMVRGRMKKGVM